MCFTFCLINLKDNGSWYYLTGEARVCSASVIHTN